MSATGDLALAEGDRFPQLLRTPSHRWWRPLLGLLLMGATLLSGGVAVILGLSLLLLAAGEDDPFGPEALDPAEPVGLLANNLLIALLIPGSVLAVVVAHRLHSGWLTSVVRRPRWGLLLRFVALAVAVVGLFFGAGFLLPVEDQAPGTAGDPERSATALIGLLVVIAVSTPLQAAAEEVGFRGYLTQAVASYARRPVVGAAVAAALSAVLFAFAHGLQDPWLFSDRLVFGLVASWLVWRTGGLEAAVALHVVNNLVTLVFSVLAGGLKEALEVSSLRWQYAVFDIAMIVAYGLAADRLARRWRVEDRRPTGALALEPPGNVGYPGSRTSPPPPAGGEHPWGMG